jgi:hypothetical protein
VTFTVALAVPPFRLAVTLVVPAATPATGICTEVWPAANATVAGTVAMEVFAELTLSVPALAGAGASVAVSVPEAPALTTSGFGASVVGTARMRRPLMLSRIRVSDLPAMITRRWLVLARTCTVRSKV